MVVGGAGFLGSHLVERMLADGHAVDVVDDLSSGSLANLATARAMGAEIKIHTLDATADELATLVAMRAPEVIYHLMWDRAGTIDARCAGRVVQATVALLEAAHANEAKVVTALPGAALYGAVPAWELPVKEGHAWEPVGLRGVLARTVADLLTMYRTEHGVEFTGLVMAHVYGPRQRLPTPGWSPRSPPRLPRARHRRCTVTAVRRATSSTSTTRWTPWRAPRSAATGCSSTSAPARRRRSASCGR